MSTNKLAERTAIETVNAIKTALVAGHDKRNALITAAKLLGIAYSTIWSRVHPDGSICRTYPHLMEGLWLQEAPPKEVEVAAIKPRVRVKASSTTDGEVFRICAIGDIHDSPHLTDKSRLKWIARHITKTRPEKVIQIGDFGDFESCSTHEPFGSIAYAERPSYKADIESLEEALHEFNKELFPTDIPKIVLEGNHEHRIYRFQNLHPETNGLFVDQLDQLWGSYGWKSYRYGEWMFLGGVGFTHAPMTIMGKPYGGKFSENAIGNDAMFSVVYGHTHRSAFRRVPKIGPAQSIEILNLGSAMPNNYIAKYAGTATTGWTYGIYDLELRGGHITGYHFISMESLEEMYGD